MCRLVYECVGVRMCRCTKLTLANRIIFMLVLKLQFRIGFFLLILFLNMMNFEDFPGVYVLGVNSRAGGVRRVNVLGVNVLGGGGGG